MPGALSSKSDYSIMLNVMIWRTIMVQQGNTRLQGPTPIDPPSINPPEPPAIDPPQPPTINPPRPPTIEPPQPPEISPPQPPEINPPQPPTIEPPQPPIIEPRMEHHSGRLQEEPGVVEPNRDPRARDEPLTERPSPTAPGGLPAPHESIHPEISPLQGNLSR